MTNMPLGELISTLKRKDQDADIKFGFVYIVPSLKIMSYRGYYEQLAIGYKQLEGDWPKVGQVVKMLKSAVGQRFTGYKGGDYYMTERTKVWVANNGETGGTAIVDVCEDQYGNVILKTACID